MDIKNIIMHFVILFLGCCYIPVSKGSVKCGIPGLPVGGYYKPDKQEYSIADQVTYYCESGRQIFGVIYRICQGTGSWTGIVPICGLALLVINATQTNTYTPEFSPDKAIDKDFSTCAANQMYAKNIWSAGIVNKTRITAVRITLPEYNQIGLEITIEMENSNKQICGIHKTTENNNVILAFCPDNTYGNKIRLKDISDKPNFFQICEVEIFTNENIQCRTPDVPQHSYKKMVYNGKLVTYKYNCWVGYELIGDSTIYCHPNGTWLPPAPVCKSITCSVPPGLLNGFVNYTRNPSSASVILYNTTAFYSCIHGFELIGIQIRTCIGIHNWSGQTPFCMTIENNSTINSTTFTSTYIDIKCLNLPNIRNGDILSTDDGIDYICDEGYNKPNVSVQCHSNGTWNANEIICIKNFALVESQDSFSSIVVIAAYLIGILTAFVIMGAGGAVCALKRYVKKRKPPRSLFHVNINEVEIGNSAQQGTEYLNDEHIYHAAIYEEIKEYIVKTPPLKRKHNQGLPIPPTGHCPLIENKVTNNIYAEPSISECYSMSSTGNTAETSCPSFSDSTCKKLDIWDISSMCNIYSVTHEEDDVFESVDPEMIENVLYSSECEDN